MTLYRVTSLVEAPDGTSYQPVFYGSFWQACRVRDAIRDGARERGEGYELTVERETVDGWQKVGWWHRANKQKEKVTM